MPNRIIHIGKNVEVIPCLGIHLKKTITSITVKTQIPPRLKDGFVIDDYYKVTIYIPCGTKQVYSAVSDWGKYKKPILLII